MKHNTINASIKEKEPIGIVNKLLTIVYIAKDKSASNKHVANAILLEYEDLNFFIIPLFLLKQSYYF